MKKVWLLLMLCCLTGCGRLQLEDRLLAVSMGLERLPEGLLQLSVQVPTSSQGGSAKGENSGDYMIFQVEGENWAEAMDALEEQSPHLLSFSQLRQVVVHEDLAASDHFFPLLRQVYRRHQIRSNAYVIVTPNHCREFLEKQKPDTGGHLGKYLDTVMKNLVAKQFVPPATLGLTVMDFSGKIEDPPLIRAELKEDKIQFLGSFLTSDGAVVGHADGHETQLLALLKGGGRRVNIRTQAGQDAEVSAFQGARVRITADGALHLQLKVTAYTPVENSPSKADVEAALQGEMEELIRKLQSMNSDAAGFKRQLWQGTQTLWEAQEKVWDFQTAPLRMEVDAQMVLSAT